MHSVVYVLAFFARIRRSARPPVKIWLEVYAPDGREAAAIWTNSDNNRSVG